MRIKLIASKLGPVIIYKQIREYVSKEIVNMNLSFPIILDGATGTELQKKGMKGNTCPEQWVIDHPDALKDIQSRYIEAGSNIIYASTFTATEHKLSEHGIKGCCAKFNTELVEISREAAAGRALVAGDMSPLGMFLKPFGDADFEDMYEQYIEQAEALESAGVDLYVIETMTSVPEMRAAVLAVRAVSNKPIIATLTCDERGYTLTGTDVCAASQILEGMNVWAVGLNCSFGPDKMLEQLRRMSMYTSLPLVAKPNAGMPTVIDGELVYSMKPEELASYVPDFARAGVAVFGACCGSDDSYISAIRSASDGFDEIYDADGRRPYNTGRSEMLPLATERQAFTLPADAAPGTVIACDDSFEDALEDIMDGDDVLVTVSFNSIEQVEDFKLLQHNIRKPLCIQCEDEAVLEAVLRSYQGRAMYDGNLDEGFLRSMADKYGLVY